MCSVKNSSRALPYLQKGPLSVDSASVELCRFHMCFGFSPTVEKKQTNFHIGKTTFWAYLILAVKILGTFMFYRNPDLLPYIFILLNDIFKLPIFHKIQL